MCRRSFYRSPSISWSFYQNAMSGSHFTETLSRYQKSPSVLGSVGSCTARGTRCASTCQRSPRSALAAAPPSLNAAPGHVLRDVLSAAAGMRRRAAPTMPGAHLHFVREGGAARVDGSSTTTRSESTAARRPRYSTEARRRCDTNRRQLDGDAPLHIGSFTVNGRWLDGGATRIDGSLKATRRCMSAA